MCVCGEREKGVVGVVKEMGWGRGSEGEERLREKHL